MQTITGRWRRSNIPRRSLLTLLAVLGVFGICTSSASATTVSVPAAGTGSNYYSDSGVYIPNGESVTITATGTWMVCPVSPNCVSGPGGIPDPYPPGGPFADPTALVGTLIGSTNAAATWSAIGVGPTVVNGPGELLLAANDTPPQNGTCADLPDPSCYSDESGFVTAVITFNNVPTDEAQCRHDGWQALNDTNGTRFRNQGACVSYVAMVRG